MLFAFFDWEALAIETLKKMMPGETHREIPTHPAPPLHEIRQQPDGALAAGQIECLAMLAHELRNPLAPIATACEILEKITGAHPQLPQIQQIISRQVAHMKRLLEDLLDAARVSSGKITLQKTSLLLADVVHHAVELSESHLVKHRHPLVIDLPSQPLAVFGDAVRLAQVFSNLLLNASKYSAPGKPVTLSACQLANGTLEISVKDEGCGIEPEMQPFIFDLFTQLPVTLDRSQGGLGIGLSMVRTLVQMHGGTVQVRSQGLDCGSEFIVVLPAGVKKAACPAPLEAPRAQARACRILIIEDNVDANETLNFCLTYEGHCVASAYSGTDGLDMVKEGGYDLVVCDIGLPGMDGYELLRQVRLLALAPEPYCIAMTGFDRKGFRAHAQTVGFNRYLVKPVTLETLQDVISEAFPAPAAHGSAGG